VSGNYGTVQEQLKSPPIRITLTVFVNVAVQGAISRFNRQLTGAQRYILKNPGALAQASSSECVSGFTNLEMRAE